MTNMRTAKLAIYVACLAMLAGIAIVMPGVSMAEWGDPVSIREVYVPDYAIEQDLSNIENLDSFTGELTPEQIDMIAKNGFVVTPSEFKQFGWIYEENNYHRPEQIPAFITTDSMLHTYHCFFDFTLREVEANKFIPVLSQLTDTMLGASEEDLAMSADPVIKDAALRNVAYFAVARKLLDGTPPPESVREMAESDIAKIEAHQQREASAIFDPILIDFTQFVPRGHYTRTEDLKKYFKTMMWYGLVLFPRPVGSIGPGPMMQALLIVRNLEKSNDEGVSTAELWETIYEPTSFYVGTADDLTYHDISGPMHEIYGLDPTPDDFADDGKLGDFVAKVSALRPPGIQQFVPLTESGEIDPSGVQFRFMGQRFIPDSRILQEMVDWPIRPFPKGLDVFAAMRSDRALDIVRQSEDEDVLSFYDPQMEKMRKEMDNTSLEKWQSNLYYGWLWGLQSIIEVPSDGYPAFMRNDAWLDKSLLTSLGSWTELRHDTVLYAKQSAAECGSDYEEPPTPKGYVEPNLEFWTRMEWLIGTTRDGLDARGLIDEPLASYFDRLNEIVSSCRTISAKELTSEEATEEEYGFMRYYGADIEGLLLSLAGGDLVDEADKDMAVVVDVHTVGGATVLQKGTGRVGAIYVVVPIGGKLYLTRGGVFTQYEFTHPASDRLTDEKWRQMLNAGEEPPFADWTSSFMVGSRGTMTYERPDTGC